MRLSNRLRVREMSTQLDAHRVVRCLNSCGRSILFIHFLLEMLSTVGGSIMDGCRGSQLMLHSFRAVMGLSGIV